MQVFVDFEYMFEDTDSDAMTKLWKDIEKKPFRMYQTVLDRNVNYYHRDQTLHNFLTFLKLFPSSKFKFDKSVAALIVFSDVMHF